MQFIQDMPHYKDGNGQRIFHEIDFTTDEVTVYRETGYHTREAIATIDSSCYVSKQGKQIGHIRLKEINPDVWQFVPFDNAFCIDATNPILIRAEGEIIKQLLERGVL